MPLLAVLPSVIIFFSSIVAGLTGFGFGLVSIPILVFLMPPQQVVPIMYLLALVVQLIVLWDGRKFLEFRRVLPLTIAGVVGIPMGTIILLKLDADTLRVIVGIVVIISSLAMMRKWNRPIRREILGLIPVGLVSGLLTGSTGMGGSPVSLFFINQDLDKDAFRSNITFYFSVVVSVAILTSFLGGLITRQVLTSAMILLPSLILGTWVGIKFSQRVNQRRFSQVIVALLIMTGLLAIGNGLGML